MSHTGAEDRGGREFFPSEEESSEPPLLLIPHHLSLLLLLLLAFNSEDLFTEPFFCFLLDADLTKNQRKVLYLFILCFIVSFEGCSVDQLHGGQTAFLADINALCRFA